MASQNEEKTCHDVREELVAVPEGTASAALYDHLADCDACRDLRHDAEMADAKSAKAGADYVHPSDFETKLLAALDARVGRTVDESDRAQPHRPVTEKMPVATKPTPAPAETPAPTTQRLAPSVDATARTEVAALPELADEGPAARDRAKMRVHSQLIVGFFVGGLAGALGFKHLGYASTVPLAALLVLAGHATGVGRLAALVGWATPPTPLSTATPHASISPISGQTGRSGPGRW